VLLDTRGGTLHLLLSVLEPLATLDRGCRVAGKGKVDKILAKVRRIISTKYGNSIRKVMLLLANRGIHNLTYENY
jgi:hypothetical protein